MNVRARACRSHFKFITMQQTCDIRRYDTRICYSGTKLGCFWKPEYDREKSGHQSRRYRYKGQDFFASQSGRPLKKLSKKVPKKWCFLPLAHLLECNLFGWNQGCLFYPSTSILTFGGCKSNWSGELVWPVVRLKQFYFLTSRCSNQSYDNDRMCIVQLKNWSYLTHRTLKISENKKKYA